MLLFLGMNPASLYFHILNFMYIFTNIYSKVASIGPRSRPNRKSFLSTVTIPHIALCTACIHPCTCLNSQKICALFSSLTLLAIFPNSILLSSLPNILSCSSLIWVLQKVHLRSTFPKCDMTVFPCTMPWFQRNVYCLKSVSTSPIRQSIIPHFMIFSSRSIPICSHRVHIGRILSKLKFLYVRDPLPIIMYLNFALPLFILAIHPFVLFPCSNRSHWGLNLKETGHYCRRRNWDIIVET
jgi:hypothetical protein